MAYANPNLIPDESSDFENGVSAWTSSAATMTVVQNGNYLTGTRSLQLAPITPGTDMWALTGYIEGIVAGKTYVGVIPFLAAGGMPIGREVGIRVAWYAAGSTTVMSYVDAQVTTVATGWNWNNFPSIVATAPAGAARARLRFLVKAPAAGELAYVDSVYLGEVASLPGNLYPYNVQSAEQDASGWLASNATLSRAFSGFPSGGRYCVRADATATGTLGLRSYAPVNVTAGVEYQANMWLFSPVVRDAEVVIQWSNAAGDEIQQSANTTTIPANTWTRCGVGGVSPVGATTAKVWLKTEVTTGDPLFIDECLLRVAPNIPGNILLYDEYSSESVLAKWTATNATFGRIGFTSSVTDGSFAIRVTPGATGLVTMSVDRLVPVVPGTTYLVGGTVVRHNPTAEITRSAFRVRIDWYDAAGNLFQADQPDQFYVTYSADEYSAHINTETRVCPEGAAFARYTAEIDHTDTVADVYYLDNAIIKESSPDYIIDPSSALGSVRLTITYQPVGPNADRISIQRIESDGSAHYLRSYDGNTDKIPYAGAPFVVEDYEAPLGTTVWYRVEWWNDAGTVRGERLHTGIIQTPVLADHDYVWFKSPGIPALNTKVMMEEPLSWARQARSASFNIVGRKNPVTVSGVRGGRTTSATILVWDESVNALFDSLLDSGLAALVQAMPGYGIDGNLYVSVGDVECEPLDPNAREHGWRWTLALTEIDRPEGGIQGSAAATWQHILDAYGTWEDLFDANGTWSDVLTKE